MGAPCSSDPDKWFGYQTGTHSHVSQAAIEDARMICLTACPLVRQRTCAKQALDNRDEFGVWAGVELPGAKHRKKAKLTEARAMLQDIADGVITSDQLDFKSA